MKSKIILTGLFLTGAVSCASFKPFVLTDAFINFESRTEITYDDLNWQNALFNQYASGLSFELRMEYGALFSFILNNTFYYIDSTGTYNFTSWDTVSSTTATADLDSVWENRIKTSFFDRSFDRNTKKANTQPRIEIVYYPFGWINFELNVLSKITYNVNVGSLFKAYRTRNTTNSLDNFYIYITFYDRQDRVLQTVLLDDRLPPTGNQNALFDLSTIITGVASYNIKYQWIDNPPFSTTGTAAIELHEFNLFTQNSQISIPDNAGGDRFGFEFVAVEWWNILGHLQNFAWWIVNESPVAPVFEWIEDYVITWVSGLITFITGVFRL